MYVDVFGQVHAKLKADNTAVHKSLVFKLLTTNKQRIQLALDILSKYDIRLPKTCKTKTANAANDMREKGNRKYITNPITRNHCMEALEFYNKSIAFAPCKSIELALAYGNRSVILLKIGKYKECIQDIDKALALEYTDHIRAKLHIRKVECLAMLSDPTMDKVRNEVQDLLEKMSLDDVVKQKMKAKLQIPCGNKQIAGNDVKNQKNMSMHLEDRNPEAYCASNALTINYTKMLGRHIIANRKILPGEPLVIEKPYSKILKMTRMYTHCANCLKPYWNLIACDNCVYAMYCSEECRSIHWKVYHDIECSVFGPLIENDCVMLDLFSLRLSIQAVREFQSVEELEKEMDLIDEWSDERTKGFCSDGKYYSDKFRSVYGLSTNVEKRHISNTFRRALDACTILYLLATRTTFFGADVKVDFNQWIQNKDMVLVGSLILQHQMTIPTNMHDIGVMYGVEQQSIGTAALPFCSLINHSCAPNITRYTNRDQTECVYATQTINEGEQIFDNYGPHYALDSKEMRQKKLREQYFFNCECVACVGNWPTYSCLKSYTVTVKNPRYRKIIRVAMEKFEDHVGVAQEGDVLSKPNMEKDLLKMIEVLCKYAPMPCTEMCNVVETLKQVNDLIYSETFEVPTIH